MINRFISSAVTASVVLASATFTNIASAQGLDWEVINPFRMYKKHEHFEEHFKAFDKLAPIDRAAPNKPRTIPANIIQLMEQELNRPYCAASMTDRDCLAILWGKKGAKERRLGWAANSHSADDLCYSGSRLGYRYHTDCAYKIDDKVAPQDYIEPKFHAVSVFITDVQALQIAGKTCQWTYASTTIAQDCEKRFTANISYPKGTTVTVRLPDGSVRSEPIQVRDILIVGLGDSFASGEGNPDRPVQLSHNWFMRYQGIGPGRPMRLTAGRTQPQSQQEIDRDVSQDNPLAAIENADRFYNASAQWVSIDCHRSQYSYQFRAAMQIAVENRKRAVTLVHVACTGADLVNGLFRWKPARENVHTKRVPSQLEQVLDLLCKNDRRDRTRAAQKTYRLTYPISDGRLDYHEDDFHFFPCKDGLKRKIDVVLMSFGGNDVGFASLVGYSVMNDASAVAPIAGMAEKLFNQKFIFGAEIAEPYMNKLLAPRFARTRDALRDLLQVTPDRVIQTSYEDIAVDERGDNCRGTEGVNVNPYFAFQKDRLEELKKFSGKFFTRLECISQGGPNCPDRTGFTFVKTHQGAFKNRGICAFAGAELNARNAPQVPGARFEPWNPARFHPYASTQRLFRSPNDAFMTANTHLRQPVNGFNDRLNLAWAALYSGAFHRNAEGHAIVADHVYREIKAIIK